jgi:hypothetical protein
MSYEDDFEGPFPTDVAYDICGYYLDREGHDPTGWIGALGVEACEVIGTGEEVGLALSGGPTFIISIRVAESGEYE